MRKENKRIQGKMRWKNECIIEIHLFGMEVNSTFIFIYNKWICRCRTVGMRFENVFFWRCIALTRKAGVTCNHLFVIFMCILVWFGLFFIFSSFILWKFMHTPTNYMFLITFQARKTLQFFFHSRFCCFSSFVFIAVESDVFTLQIISCCLIAFTKETNK